MRRFILLLVSSFLLISCNNKIPTLTDDPGVVYSISSCNVNIWGYKYRVSFQITTKSGGLKEYELFTNKLYTVGDTIRIK